uniref:Actin-related protein 10 n=1 Tax=Haemonchus contortus TaxID=6289 RepID=A0A7I5EAY1_HAECO|nr:Actin actin domain containing protein [Haemonchus contortus]
MAVRSNTSRRSLSALATCTSLSQAINSIDNSKPAVVLDLGRRLTKVGYAGEFVPRAIIHSQFLHESIYECGDAVCDRPQASRPTLNRMVKFFRNIFNSYLLTMPRERRVVIVESLLTPTQFRETVCEALLEVLNVPSVLFIPSHLAATFPFNTEYALVVDVGYMETLAVPIAENVTMLSCWELSNVGSKRLEDRVRELLKIHGRVDGGQGLRELTEDDWKVIEDSNIVEDICVRFVFCCPFERGKAIQSDGASHGLPPVKSVKVPLNAEFLVIPGFVREAACEVFFERGNEDASVAQMIHSLVDRCPIDLRKRMFESILLLGGTTLIPGFLSRLKEEIADIAKTSPSKMKQCESIRFYRFPDQSVELYLGWLGGSMFGSLQDAVRLRSISRETWMEEHILPDWTDYVQHGIPCGKPELDR